jgi:hypothetical protein
MAEIGDVGQPPAFPGQRVGAAKRMQSADGKKSAGDRHARGDQPAAEAVEQVLRRNCSETGFDQPGLQGDKRASLS